MNLTLQNVNEEDGARSFLENITYLPMEPMRTTIITFLSFFTLLAIIRIKSMVLEHGSCKDDRIYNYRNCVMFVDHAVFIYLL